VHCGRPPLRAWARCDPVLQLVPAATRVAAGRLAPGSVVAYCYSSASYRVYGHATTETKDEVESGFLLDVIVGEGATILKLLSSEDEALLIRRDTFLILDLLLDVVNGVGGFDFKSDGLASQSLHEDLHASTETEDKVESGLLLDVVVREGTTILELLSSEDEALLIRRDTFLVLDFLLDIVNGVGRLDFKGDGFASQGLHEDLHASTETEDKVESGFLLDVVVGEGSTILELLSSENKTLLIRRDTFLVLDLLLHGLKSIRRVNIKSDCLASQSLDKDLHATS